MRSEFQDIEDGFDKMPDLTAGTAVVVNSAGTALSNTVGKFGLAGDLITTGAFNTTLVQQATVVLTLPAVSGTLALVASPAASIVVGTTAVTSGTSGRVLYDNAGILGEMTNTGTGTVNVLQASPSITSPTVTTSLNVTTSTDASVVITSSLGTVSSGTTIPMQIQVTATGAAAGTADIRAMLHTITYTGSTNLTGMTLRAMHVEVMPPTGTTIAVAYGDQSYLRLGNFGDPCGDLTAGYLYEGHIANEGLGNIGGCAVFFANSLDFHGYTTGNVVISRGFFSGDMAGGDGTKVTTAAIAYDASDITVGSPITAAFRSLVTADTNKWGFFASGSANNAFLGNTTIGAVSASTTTLGVVGTASVTTAYGTLANGAGSQTPTLLTVSFTGSSSGDSNVRALINAVEVDGVNVSEVDGRGMQIDLFHTGTLASAYGDHSYIWNHSSGAVTAANVYAAQYALTGSGNIAAAVIYNAQDTNLSSGAGSFGTIYGFAAGNYGHATRVTGEATGFYSSDMTAGAPLTTSLHSLMNSGTNKWAIYVSGTANSAFNGKIRVGGLTAPVATVDVTGTITASGVITGASFSGSVALGSITGFGTGVAAALAINTGSAGAPVLFNGAGGTPSSMTATNLTGTAAGLTAGTASAVAVGGITGLGTGVATFLGTPTSANLAAAVTDETGSGALVFAASPTLSGTIGGALTFSGAIVHSSTTTLSNTLTYGGVTLANSVTGTGSMVLAASPTLTTGATLTGLDNTAQVTLSIVRLSGNVGLQLYTVGSTGNSTINALQGSLILQANTVTAITLSGSTTVLAGALRLSTTYVPGVVAATGTMAMQDATGTTYNVLVHT